jgi:hypothetical protein
VEQAVTDGIGQGWVTDVGMPVTDRTVAGNGSGARLVAVFHNFQQVSAFRVGGVGEQEVIDNEKLYLSQRLVRVFR